MNFNNNFDFSYSKNFIFDHNNYYINPKIYCLKGKIKGIFRNVNLIFTHNEETNKQFLINLKIIKFNQFR